MKEKVLFIVNPSAGKGTGRKILPEIKTLLTPYASISEVVLTEGKNHATELVRNYKDNYPRICGIGGDGTLNEIVNGFCDGDKNILGIIPVGSGNDLARTAGIRKELSTAFDIMLNSKNIRSVDVGVMDFKEYESECRIIRRFINSAGIGFDALVSDLIRKNKLFKGLPLYIFAVIEALFKYRVMTVTGTLDDNPVNGIKLLIAISNGKTYGGGIKVNPGAKMSDGYLDACVIANLSIPQIIKDFPKFVKGQHGSIDGISLMKFRTADIQLDAPVYIHADGEVISYNTTQVKIRLAESKLNLVFSPEKAD
ncbi:MAG: diacylglycerol/lipid kinase family protein [Ignavibacteriales bacterium]